MNYYRRIFERLVRPKIVSCIPNECWNTTLSGGRSGNNYRDIRVSHNPNRVYRIHRLAYLAFVGSIPDGMSVLHSCDNKGCCNPNHLRVGTQAENIADMDKRGRRGTWHPVGNLNPSKRADVRRKLSEFAKNRKRGYHARFTCTAES